MKTKYQLHTEVETLKQQLQQKDEVIKSLESLRKSNQSSIDTLELCLKVLMTRFARCQEYIMILGGGKDFANHQLSKGQLELQVNDSTHRSN